MRRASGFLEARGPTYRIDRRKKLGTLISNEIILFELRDFLDRYFGERGATLLDLGAGTKPYAPLYEKYFRSCVAVDVPHSSHDLTGIDVFASAEVLPFEDETFDCILCTEVIEHCPDPNAVFAEINRVLKPGGRAFLTTPFFVPLHEIPYDYYRYTPYALRNLAASNGLEVTTVRPRGEYLAVMITMATWPVVKGWQLVSRVTRVQLSHPTNPVLYASVILPQLGYLALWRRIRVRERGAAHQVYMRLSRTTLGYATTVIKPEAAPGRSEQGQRTESAT